MEFKRPNKSNVSLGDILVVSRQNHGISMFPITQVRDLSICANSEEWGHFRRIYDDAIVLKKDGSYLVGKKSSYQIGNAPIMEK